MDDTLVVVGAIGRVLMERRVGPQHMVRDEDMVIAQVFRRLGEVPYGARVRLDLRLREDDSDFH